MDFILDGVRHMPDPGKIIEPLGWFALGIAGTAALEAYNADPGSTHRHMYVVVAIASAALGVGFLYCAGKIKREGQKHAKWLEDYVLKLYDSFGLTPPVLPLRWWQRFGRYLRRVR